MSMSLFFWEGQHSLISGEYGAIGSLFISPFYPRETEAFEWAPSDEHASFQHNWHNLSYQNVSMDGVSPISQQVREKVLGNINGSCHQGASKSRTNLRIINMLANVNCWCALCCSDSCFECCL